MKNSKLWDSLAKDRLAKLDFVNARSLPSSGQDFHPVDLAINIDSFQEMPKETIRYYFEQTIGDVGGGYSRSAVGKYRPSKQFTAIEQEPLGISPYYQNVLYERSGDQ